MQEGSLASSFKEQFMCCSMLFFLMYQIHVCRSGVGHLWVTCGLESAWGPIVTSGRTEKKNLCKQVV